MSQIQEELTKLEIQRDNLVDRLDRGSTTIGLAREEKQISLAEIEAWENHWIAILKEYEQVCQQIRALQSQQTDSAA